MKKINLFSALQGIKSNILLIFSSFMALFLFFSSTNLVFFIELLSFFLVVLASIYDKTKPAPPKNKLLKRTRLLLTILFEIMGGYVFYRTWFFSYQMNALADTFHQSKLLILFILGLPIGLMGFYALHVLSGWIINKGYDFLFPRMLEHSKVVLIANIKTNWYFPLSALAFFLLEMVVTFEYCLGIFIAFAISLLIASQITSIWELVKRESIFLKIICVFTSAGICLAGQKYSYLTWHSSAVIQKLQSMISISIDLVTCMSVLGAILSFIFVYVWLHFFWKKMYTILKDAKLFNDLKLGEIIVYALVLVCTLVFTTMVFLKTDVFYGTEFYSDLIYTSDSPMLIKYDVYLTLTYGENDLRQPLSAVFSSPFLGIPYLIGNLFSVTDTIHALLLNYVQIVLLIFTNYMIAKIMRLSPGKRVLFMLLSCCSYTYLLFALMMEQYIIAYFWLIFFFYLVCEANQPKRLAFWGAAGTLLTSIIVIPFMSSKTPLPKKIQWSSVKEWLTEMVSYGIEFVILILAFCRFDIFFNFFSRLSFLDKFVGTDLSFWGKILQYIAFVQNYFFAPDTVLDYNTPQAHISLQLAPITAIKFVGLFILLLVLASAVLNKNKKSTLLATGWICFSFILLCVVGWGTQENGLILYSLYFGWAFWVLLFQLIEKLENKLQTNFLVPSISAVSVLALLIINSSGIQELVNFSTTYFSL